MYFLANLVNRFLDLLLDLLLVSPVMYLRRRNQKRKNASPAVGETCNKEKEQVMHISEMQMSRMHISRQAGGAYQQDTSQKKGFAAQGSGGIIYGFSPTKNLTSFFADYNTLFVRVDREN